MPRICLSESDLSRPRQGDAELQEVCYQKHTNLRCRWPVWNKATFVMDEGKLIILVQGHECLYNLQYTDYDNSLVKDNSWKEIAGGLHAQDEERSPRTQHCRRMAGSWQGNGMLCVNLPSTRHRNGMVCVNRPVVCHGLLIVKASRFTLGRTFLDETVRRRACIWQHSQEITHPCPRRYSNPQSQQANGRGPTS
jgi:hypothetical protein